MAGDPSATWFVEVEGEKQGPYTSQQIVKLVMDGALKVESRVFDSTAGAWKIAADVIPYLDLGAPNENESGWRPPTRPKELRDTHVVDGNEDAAEADYYALVSDRKGNQDKPSSQVSRATSSRAQTEKPASQSEASAPKKQLLSTVRRAEAAPQTPRPDPKPKASAASDSLLIAQPDSPASQLEAGAGKIFGSLGSILKRAKQNRTAMSIAAGLALVFLGTYGAIKMFSQHKNTADREVAATAQPLTRPTDPKHVEARAASSDELGSGKHRVYRATGGITPPAALRSGSSNFVSAPPIQPTQSDTGQEPPREPAQYYSSSDNQEMAPVPQAYPPPGADTVILPAGGTVQPPGFIPPQTPMTPQAPVDPDSSQSLYSQ